MILTHKYLKRSLDRDKVLYCIVRWNETAERDYTSAEGKLRYYP